MNEDPQFAMEADALKRQSLKTARLVLSESERVQRR